MNSPNSFSENKDLALVVNLDGTRALHLKARVSCRLRKALGTRRRQDESRAGLMRLSPKSSNLTVTVPASGSVSVTVPSPKIL